MAKALILNFDGPDGSTSYTEEVGGLVPSNQQNCEIDTSWSKFGSGSLKVPSGGSLMYENIPPNSGDLTAHAFFKCDTLPASMEAASPIYFLDVWPNDSNAAAYLDAFWDEEKNGLAFSFFAQDADDNYEEIISDAVIEGAEYHLAVVVKDAVVMFFINGKKKATIELSLAPSPLTSYEVAIGSTLSSFMMHMDALEITHEALWDADFTPPTAAPTAGRSVNIPCAQMSLVAFHPYGHDVMMPAKTASFIPAAFSFGPGPFTMPLAELTLTPYGPSFSWAVPAWARHQLQAVYQCVLTGDADGLDDLVVPMSSFQSTIRRGDVYFMVAIKPYMYIYGGTPDASDLYWLARYPLWTAISVNVPNVTDYIADIAARSNGDIVIKKGYKNADGEINYQEICRAAYESIAREKTPFGYSATLSGSRVRVQGWSKRRDIENIHEYGVDSEGMRRFRTAPDLFLNIGDTMSVPASVSGEEADSVMLVGEITYAVNTQTESMEITEGANPADETEPEADPTVDQWETQQENIELYGVQPYPQY